MHPHLLPRFRPKASPGEPCKRMKPLRDPAADPTQSPKGRGAMPALRRWGKSLKLPGFAVRLQGAKAVR